MEKFVHDTSLEMAAPVAGIAAEAVRSAIEAEGRANIILATGASRIEMLHSIVPLKTCRIDTASCFS